MFGFLPPTFHLDSDFTPTFCWEAYKGLLCLVHMLIITLLSASVSPFLTSKQHSSTLGVISLGSLSGAKGGDPDRLHLVGPQSDSRE